MSGASPTPPAVARALREVGRSASEWRRLQDLTIEQVADRAGIGLATVKRIEAGQGASLENVLRVARALGIVDQVVAAFDPSSTDLGRARALEHLPRRASGRRGSSPR